MRAFYFIRSLLYVLICTASISLYILVCVLCFPLPVSTRYKITMAWPKFSTWFASWFLGIRWQKKGWENIPDTPCIILAKHQSAWETCFLPGYFPHELCFVYKRELNWLPFFGWGLALLDMIAINRSRGSEAFEQIVTQGRRKAAEGRWVIFFPEGTRTLPGAYKPYKTGGARLALRLGLPVLPIAINSGECWPRNAFIKTPGTITVSVGPVIRPEGHTMESLTQATEDWIEAEMRVLAPHRYAQAAPEVQTSRTASAA